MGAPGDRTAGSYDAKTLRKEGHNPQNVPDCRNRFPFRSSDRLTALESRRSITTLHNLRERGRWDGRLPVEEPDNRRRRRGPSASQICCFRIGKLGRWLAFRRPKQAREMGSVRQPFRTRTRGWRRHFCAGWKREWRRHLLDQTAPRHSSRVPFRSIWNKRDHGSSQVRRNAPIAASPLPGTVQILVRPEVICPPEIPGYPSVGSPRIEAVLITAQATPSASYLRCNRYHFAVMPNVSLPGQAQKPGLRRTLIAASNWTRAAI